MGGDHRGATVIFLMQVFYVTICAIMLVWLCFGGTAGHDQDNNTWRTMKTYRFIDS